ncbi:2-keto-4-pentenoate hydratase/2-oxohepta-3-ene-1,7-dioic acid hydratase in catechol pathway [Kaistia hirudinis]|uniref:2-keto-4-pentenoate hydratase/2-oxohepta-3-ene-1,7-dioic acid hydratase in catechol pathway n=1 Tax=Kaistia hirudinis TaxID=1293440 RepID=A0A840ANH0_9HYPH|nr:fumarylacetoacetate hydrolase family protein [Kaistia hirudinis]MBB3931172.1 2-keto-4-pentenoate hydratase/2-oxohepta-3-ene-1,7-dioic acid hydratase in catechol pathway [Kaistia hirudinis]
MRYSVVLEEGERRLAVVDGGRFAILGPDFADLRAVLVSPGAEEAMRRRVSLAEADWRPLESARFAQPFARPGKIVCLGLNYRDHALEGGYAVPDYPALFLRTATSLLAAGAPIVAPAVSEKLDFEAELLVIVGQGGRRIAEADALRHVFGYACFNDASIRDFQRKTHQWTPGKNFDGTGAIGPVVVTADELPAGASGLAIRCRLNGTTVQDANTADMLVSVPRAIAIISEFMTLEPGDMIAMGTPQGVGHARNPPLWMRPGDDVEVEIERIGILRNPIVAEDSAAVPRAS